MTYWLFANTEGRVGKELHTLNEKYLRLVPPHCPGCGLGAASVWPKECSSTQKYVAVEQKVQKPEFLSFLVT